MSVIQFIQGSAFSPEDVQVIVAAYEKACARLAQIEPVAGMEETLAKKIIGLAERGERDPEAMCWRALDALSNAPDETGDRRIG